MNQQTVTITLNAHDQRTWMPDVEKELVKAGLIEVANAIRAANPRDLAEVHVLLPANVGLVLEGRIKQ